MTKPTMLERVARAIDPPLWIYDLEKVERSEGWKTSVRRDRQASLEAARRVLEALRDPDEQMLKAGAATARDQMNLTLGDSLQFELRHMAQSCYEHLSIAEIFRTMIDTAFRP
jgi:hypothetical protein